MDKNTIISLLREMLYVRLVEERVCNLYPEQEMRCPVHISIGQEATAVGVCANLSDEDWVFSNHRGHGHYLAKKGDLKKFFAELYGKETGCAKGKGGSMHLVDIPKGFIAATAIVSSTVPVSVGSALSFSMKNSNQVSTIFMGDASTEEGVFHESMNFAKLKNLPVLFFCENNFYSVYSPLSVRQPPRGIIDIAKAHGLDCYTVDGNDVIDVYETCKVAIEKMRLGGGPAFIEGYTYRWREHCGPNYDNDLGYRSEEEFEHWKKKDPLERLKRKIMDENILTAFEIVTMENEINKQIDEAVSFAKASSFPSKEELDKHIYAD